MLQYPSMSPRQSSMRSAVMTVARSNNRCYSIQLPLDFFFFFFTVGRTILTTDCRYVLYMDVEKFPGNVWEIWDRACSCYPPESTDPSGP